MSKIPVRRFPLYNASHTQIYGKNKTVKSEIKTYIKYSKLDRTKIKKCSRCNHFVDLISEGWSKTELFEYSKLTEYQASQTSYVCKYCDSTKFLNQIFEIQYEANASKLEGKYKDFANEIGEKACQVLDEIKEVTREKTCQVLDETKAVTRDCVARLNVLNENVLSARKLYERLTAESEEIEQKITDINEKLIDYETRSSYVVSSAEG